MKRLAPKRKYDCARCDVGSANDQTVINGAEFCLECASLILFAGFMDPGDAIVPCKRCGAAEGFPCRPLPKDKDLKTGFVHLARRLKRLLLTANARGNERREFETEAVKMLRKHLMEKTT